MIKAIAFDYGGVIKINDSDLFKEISDYLKIDKEDWKKEYFTVNHLANIKGVDFEELLTIVVSRFDNSEKTKKHILNLCKKDKNKHHLNGELIDVIKILKDKNYKIALLSNNSIKLRQKLIENGIADLFEVTVFSTEVGYQKPQPEIFDILFKKLEVNPGEVVFIDDTPRSLEGADKIGYLPILYKDNKSFKVELSNILGIEI